METTAFRFRVFINGTQQELRYFYYHVLFPLLSNLDVGTAAMEQTLHLFRTVGTFDPEACKALIPNEPKSLIYQAKGKFGEYLKANKYEVGTPGQEGHFVIENFREKVCQSFNLYKAAPIVWYKTHLEPERAKRVLEILQAKCPNETCTKDSKEVTDFLKLVITTYRTKDGWDRLIRATNMQEAA